MNAKTKMPLDEEEGDDDDDEGKAEDSEVNTAEAAERLSSIKR